jgi:prephenate dehydrogenase
MNDDPVSFISDYQIGILGLGLMGGSLAMALQGKCAGIIAVDPDPKTQDLALELGIVDEMLSITDDRLSKVDMFILAAPVRVIIRLIEDLPDIHPGSPVVLDLGSSKSDILTAMQDLPARFDPLGGHPMCGKEHGTLRNAEANLFQGASFALTPLSRSSNRARRSALDLVEAIGAKALWLEPDLHDRWVSMTSHLPFLVANTLAGITPLDAAPLVGPGFRSTTRLAPSPTEMMVDILITNRENLLAGIKEFQAGLAALEARLVAEDDKGLHRLLEAGAQRYQELVGR